VNRLPLWSSALLTVALSADSLSVGIAYGIRAIRLPAGALAVVGLCTAALMGLSMALGSALSPFVTPQGAARLGGTLLIAMGAWQIAHSRPRQLEQYEGSTPETPLLHWAVPGLGVVVQVLRHPASADANRSGAIDGGESLLLGTALGLDAFAAGFGAGMSGFPFWIVLAVAAASVAFIFCGWWVGARGMARRAGAGPSWAPGLLLMVVGLLRSFSP